MADDLSRRHLKALQDAFSFASAEERIWQAGARQCHENQLKVVRDFIDLGVPCGPDSSELIDVFLSNSWAGRCDAAALWKAYAAAGYIDSTRLLSVHTSRLARRPGDSTTGNFVRMLPLELAALREHVQAFDALLESGATIQDIPSQQWKPSKRSPMDALGCLHHLVRTPSTLATLRASAARAMGALPLELAVLTGDLADFDRLVAAGHDLSRIPTRAWLPGAAKSTDALAFIKRSCKDITLAEQFTSVARRGLMATRIDRGPTGPVASGTGSEGRSATVELRPTGQRIQPRARRGAL